VNKKVNTILFVLCATLFNILITVMSFLLLLTVYANFIIRLLPESTQAWAFPLIIMASLAVAFLVYRSVIRFLVKKIEIEEYFAPIFARKNRNYLQ
jgi:hypothetical protein